MHESERSESLKKTLETYEQHFDQYLAGTPQEVSGEFKAYLDYLSTRIDTNAVILEIGSGTGRDASYLESKGFGVLRSDVAKSFIEHLKNSGRDAVYFDALHTDLGRKFDAILALAVFLHFNEREFEQALKNVARHLQPNGLFALLMKDGVGEGYSEHKMGTRFFRYWKEEELVSKLTEYDFEIIDIRHSLGGKWVHVTARYRAE